MSKKQRERKERKLEQKRQGNAPPAWLAENLSPQIRAVMSELSSYTPSRTEQEMIQALSDSNQLREEAELQEFTLETGQVERAMARLIPKYEQKLTAAKMRSNDEWEGVYDDLRVEAIDTLLPREWRQNFLRQYDAMMRRLSSGTDTKRFKLALLVRSALDDKTFPWGASALFGEMFEDAKEESRERALSAEELLSQLLKPLGADATPEELDKILHDPARLEKLEESLNLSPEQQDLVDEMTTGILEEFERGLYAGQVDLPLYTGQELDDTTEQLNYLTAAVRAQGREMGVEDYEAIGKLLQGRVEDIVTPERLNEINEQVTLTADEWLAQGNEDGRLLHMEQSELLELEPRENSFLYAALVGQLRRVEEPEGEFDEEIGAHVIDASSAVVADSPTTDAVPADTPPADSPTADSTTEALNETQTHELRERLRGMFKRQI